MKLEKYSMGTGDRFGLQGKAQLQAMIEAKKLGIDLAIVWNKSYREHSIIHTDPASVRQEADNAVKELGWEGGYHVDADHIGLKTVDIFVDSSDFYTLDVADFTGEKADDAAVKGFVQKYASYCGELKIDGITDPIHVDEGKLQTIAEKYLLAVKEAGKIYRHIEEKKGEGNFITEVSMDETDLPQTPDELVFILAMIADEKIPAQTIAPKFSGRFNKGVDYVGDVQVFEKEFEEDVCVIKYAIREFGMEDNLKLSVHSGSDKFGIYSGINRILKKHDCGLHLKTAGTTWLEEIIGLAEAGGKALDLAKDIYAKAFSRFEELAGPYATVIDIDESKLPSPETVNQWDSKTYVDTLRHEQDCELYNIHFRQLLHVGYKVAAEKGDEYLSSLKENEAIVAKNVSYNILERHIKRIFA